MTPDSSQLSSDIQPDQFDLLHQPGPGRWAAGERRRQGLLSYTFYGGDDFIVYERPRRVEALRPWLANLGIFQVVMSWSEDAPDVEVTLECSVWADGFVRHDQVLRFRVI